MTLFVELSQPPSENHSNPPHRLNNREELSFCPELLRPRSAGFRLHKYRPSRL